MQSCWNGNPQKRPSFDDLENSVSPLLRSDVVQNIIDLNSPYLTKNTNHTNSDGANRTESLNPGILEGTNGDGMEMKRFCCCFSLRTGGLTIATLRLFFSCLSLTLSFTSQSGTLLHKVIHVTFACEFYFSICYIYITFLIIYF